MNAYAHLSSGSKRNLGRAIQRVMNWAVEQELIDHNPLAGMWKPKAGKRERVISDAEWRDILSLVPDEDLRDLLVVTWETGCRPQESLIVEARHVDLTNSRWVFAVAESKTEPLLGTLDHDLDILLQHPLADVPMNDEAAVAVEDADQEVERAGDVQVADVDVPVLVRPQRLDEARAFFEGMAQCRPRWPACESTRYTVAGLTATISASSIM